MAVPPSRIAVLSPELADLIAAGEVVERPASVVKELCENALDAGARRIDVEIEGGGRRLIRVVDDGCGMTAEEAELALLRHATSKLRAASDLLALETMGFRGEALPAIAAVSHLVLTTRLRGALEACRVRVEAGRKVETGAAGAPEGTSVEVRDLFYNVPARLKFLKSEPSEAAHISEAVQRLALAFPGVHLRLRHGGRLALDLPIHPDLGERARLVLRRVLHPAEGEEGGFRVRALLAAPTESQTTGRGVYLYVGRRGVRDRGLAHALAMGYGELLERGRHPVAVLVVDPPAGAVDVNVHPQKTEVRFARPQEVHAAVRHVVAQALARAPWLQVAPAAAVRVYSMPPQTDEHRARVREAVARYVARAPAQERLFAAPGAAALAAVVPAAPEPESGAAPPDPPVVLGPEAFFGALRYLGQLAETYLVCEAPGELVLVDQHAAHERVAFARLREAHEKKRLGRQRLLFPALVELEPAALAAAADHQSTLEALGFEVELFGPATLAVKAVPELLGDASPAPLLSDVLGELGARAATEVVDDRIDHVLATMACHSVVRAGDRLGEAQARGLLSALDEVDFRGHCPHGRPVVLRLPLGELERRFGRT